MFFCLNSEGMSACTVTHFVTGAQKCLGQGKKKITSSCKRVRSERGTMLQIYNS